MDRYFLHHTKPESASQYTSVEVILNDAFTVRHFFSVNYQLWMWYILSPRPSSEFSTRGLGHFLTHICVQKTIAGHSAYPRNLIASRSFCTGLLFTVCFYRQQDPISSGDIAVRNICNKTSSFLTYFLATLLSRWIHKHSFFVTFIDFGDPVKRLKCLEVWLHTSRLRWDLILYLWN